MFTTIKKERKLRDGERLNHLSIDGYNPDLNAYTNVIRMNSTYLETVDYMYKKRGIMSLFGIFAFAIMSAGTILLSYGIFSQYQDPNWDRHDESEMLLATISMIMILLLFIVGLIFFYRTIGEWFRYTHYPVRFNRKNRMVYLFRDDDTVLSIPWDELYFTIQFTGAKYSAFNIWALVMKDPQTVQEMFNLGDSSVIQRECLEYWEFVRRYMEKGVPAVIKAPGLKYYLPIADKRETIHQGWIALGSKYTSMPIFKTIITPFLAFAFIGRFIYRWTSKVPLCPKDIEAECLIEPNDPYICNSRTNPEGYR